MREILFRGKAITGKWIYGYYEKYNGGSYINLQTDRLNSGGYPIREFIEVTPETVGQYTGLTNRNGKKIYEGDIVEYQEEYGCIEYADEEAMFTISFDTWFTDFDHIYGKELEVIGNIHDNPELLKGGVEE